MVQVKGSSGEFVQVNIKGVSEIIENLRSMGVAVKTRTDIQLMQAATFVNTELQESLLGNRAEPKSVDTGTLANSIEVTKEGQKLIIAPAQKKYPNSDVTTEQVLLWLEYGTSPHFVAPVKAQALHWVVNGKDFFSKGHTVAGIEPRRHFRNTVARVRPIIIGEFGEAISVAIKETTGESVQAVVIEK